MSPTPRQLRIAHGRIEGLVTSRIVKLVATSFRTGLVPLIVSIVILVFSRLWRLSFYSLDGDEIFSVQAARQNWSKMMQTIAIDLVHPPLFYAVLKIWMAIEAQSVFWLRLLPAFLGIVSVVPLIMICRELQLRRLETAMVVFLFSVNGFLIGYAQQVRMYSLALFCSLVSIWLFIRYIDSVNEQRKILTILFLGNLALVYSHYFGWLVVGVESLIVLVWNRRRLPLFAIMDVLLMICYLPWIFAVLQANNEHPLSPHINWIGPPSIRGLVWFYAQLNGPFEFSRSTTLGVLLFGIPVLITTWTLIKKRDNTELRRLLWLYLLAFLPSILAFCIGWSWQHSIFGDRHLIICAAPYLMLVTVGAYRLPSKLVASVVISAILAWSTVSGFRVIETPERKLQWSWLASEIYKRESRATEPVTVFALEHFVAIALEFNLEVQPQFLKVERSDFNSIKGEHFWVAFRNTTWKESRQPQDLLRDSGYHVDESIRITAQGQTITVFPVDRR